MESSAKTNPTLVGIVEQVVRWGNFGSMESKVVDEGM